MANKTLLGIFLGILCASQEAYPASLVQVRRLSEEQLIIAGGVLVLGSIAAGQALRKLRRAWFPTKQELSEELWYQAYYCRQGPPLIVRHEHDRIEFQSQSENLIKQGADVNTRLAADGKTPLIHAIEHGDDNLGFVKELVRYGALIEQSANGGARPLMYAAGNRGTLKPSCTKIVEFLLNNHADVNAQDGCGRTALMYAAQVSDTNICSLLLRKGADHSLKDHKGKTVFDYAQGPYPCHERTLEFLQQAIEQQRTEQTAAVATTTELPPVLTNIVKTFL